MNLWLLTLAGVLFERFTLFRGEQHLQHFNDEPRSVAHAPRGIRGKDIRPPCKVTDLCYNLSSSCRRAVI